MSEPYRVRVTVRGYELDTQGHLNQAVYLQYAEHARWEYLRAAGISQDRLLASGIGPVVLETTIRYLRELRGGDDVDVTCAFGWTSAAPGPGEPTSAKTFRMMQTLVTADGTLAADITAVGGLLDLTARRLVADPRARLLKLATNPDLIDARPRPRAQAAAR